MKKTGVFNPFATPKEIQEERGSATAEEPFNTEWEPVPKPTIRLDGDSYALELRELELDDVPQRLGSLFKEVQEHYKEDLQRHGITLSETKIDALEKPGIVTLDTPEGYLHVFVGTLSPESDTEVAAFRRMAYALGHTNVPTILKEHKAKVIVR